MTMIRGCSRVFLPRIMRSFDPSITPSKLTPSKRGYLVTTISRSIHLGVSVASDFSPKWISKEHRNIPDFYRGKSVLITGGTGFMGKVLVERLLTTCPDINKLYLIIREKEGHTVEKRLQLIKNSPVFDMLRDKDPQQLDKIVAIAGDVTNKQLGLNENDRTLLKRVSVIFHVAATVSFSEALKAAVAKNVLPVIELLDICDTLPKLEALVYISTLFSNCEHKKLKEKIYPPPIALKDLLDLTKNQHLEEAQTAKLVAPKPNTYIYTKAMAEYMIGNHKCNNFSAAIIRPSIVISALKHPFPGWVDSSFGASQVVSAASKGMLKVCNIKRSARGDMIPVDISIDTFIAVAWEIATEKPSEVRVYNNSNADNPITWGYFTDTVNEFMRDYPSEDTVMYPKYYCVSNRYLYQILETILQTVPLYVIEYIRRALCKQSSNLIHANKKMQKSTRAVSYFTTREWDVELDNVKKLRKKLSENDKKLYNLDTDTINWHELLRTFVIGNRKYVLGESDESLASARARVRNVMDREVLIADDMELDPEVMQDEG